MVSESESPDEKPLLLTEKETARMLGFSRRTLQGWRGRGTGPHYVEISPRCIRYRRSDIEKWIQERLRRSTSNDGQ